MGQTNTDESPLSMQEWNQKVGLRHLDRIKELFKKDPDEEFERRLESLSRGKTKGIIYYAAGIKKDSHERKFRELEYHERKSVRKAALDLWVDLNSIPKDLL
ncbi:TPA: hypothetical protein ACPZFU_002998 [Yersinia enterocolitica]|nr:hypothetical protein [Yersinia enterocolitica]EKN3326778.1 hypothetical protein [Yersinia enterocolitica]EKN3350879.1 hypothetical protein [Yersinia enterocolitica]EKN3359142.1 hypothetical protein [Yersinia enterocolitica]EKN3365492.1 hypothetical protein [Yersinia enterocolitica]EKN3382026.1 hypothetical protein [Yersinia enterocolitica]